MACGTCGRAFDPCPFCFAGAMLRQGPPVLPRAPVLPVHDPNTLPGMAVLGFSCAIAGAVRFTNVASGAVLYVLRNEEVEFRAHATGIAQGVVVNFDAAVWGGTAGAAGNGRSRRVRFGANSASNAQAHGFTVTLAFSGQNATVTVIVFELRTTAAIADNFAGRSTTDLGVDERVALGFATTPAGVTAVQAGGLRWKLADGTAANRDTVGLFHDTVTHMAPAGDTGVVDYIAPCRTYPAGTAPVPRKPLTLKLEIVGGICAGLGPELAYTICHPTAHMREAAGGVRRHVQGRPSSGFHGEVFLTPKNVSFRTLRWREGAGAMVISGHMPAAWAGFVHPVTVFGDAMHGTINGGDIARGCVVNQVDNVYSGDFAYVVPDRPSPLTEVGSQSWPIIWEYTYPTLLPAPPGWSGVWIEMQRAHHIAKLYENGAMTMFKGHVACASGDCMPAPLRKEIDDPTVP